MKKIVNSQCQPEQVQSIGRNYILSSNLTWTRHLFEELFFFYFPPNFARSWKVVTRAYSDGATQLKDGPRVNPTINTKLFIALVLAAQRARTRQATVFAERQSHDQLWATHRFFYGGGFIKQRAFVFTPGWINKRPSAQLPRYLHPCKDKTVRRTRIMGSGAPS